MAIHRRYYGQLVIEIWDEGRCDHAGREKFHGRIVLPDGRTWSFSDLACHGGVSHAAENAVTFGSYYSSGNRGNDVPEYAPPREIADAIDAECDYLPDYVDLGELGEMDDVEVIEEKVICETRAAQRRFYALCEKGWNEAQRADRHRGRSVS